ncbi:extracellular solute-binding protein [soil metagenome]
MQRSPHRRRAALIVAGALAASLLLPGAAAAQTGWEDLEGQHEGVEINVLTFTGPQIAEPLQRRAPEFQALSGATVNVVTVPFADLYTSILTDVATGTNSYDAFVFAPQWMGDYVVPGFLEDLTEFVDADERVGWQDIGPFFRDFSATYQGQVYAVPLDGDFHMVYYRSDLLQAADITPPATWDDYLAIAEQFHGQDLNEDGEADYGSCISKARNQQAYWFIHSVASPFIQTQGTGEGVFFDQETLAPLIDNAGFRRAMEIYKATTDFGPPDELNLGVGDTRGLFTSGRCALSIDWGDIGTLALGTYAEDKTGAVITPGTTEVLDRASGELVACDEMTCPHAIGGVNHAPFSAFGGWSGAINAASENAKKDAARAFLGFMTAPAQSNVDVTIGATGFNPYRTSQFESLEPWVAAGMSEEAAGNYLGAIQESLGSPNMVLDLRVPKSQQYQQVVLDQAVAQYLVGEIDLDTAAAQITAGWEEVTDAEGRDAQQAAYLASLGVER